MYIIGDVHGCYLTLLALVEKLPKDEPIFFTGDLIDRGPRSKEVVQWLIDNPSKCKSVKGNHEQMLLQCYEKNTMSARSSWGWNGGEHTMDSYFPESAVPNDLYGATDEEVEAWEKIKENRNVRKIPKEHIEFFDRMPLFIREDRLFVSHSSWNPRIPWDRVLEMEDKTGMMGHGLTWNRGIPGILPENMYHVFGHTPVARPDITHYYADIDTGAVFHDWEYGGKLTAIHYPTLEIFQQENLDFPKA